VIGSRSSFDDGRKTLPEPSLKHKKSYTFKYSALSVSTEQRNDAMLGHSTLFNHLAQSFSIRPAGSPTNPQNLSVASRKRATVIPLAKKAPEEEMEAPIPAGTSNGAGAPTNESGDGATGGLSRNDSIPVSKRADGLGGFDAFASPMRGFSLCCMIIDLAHSFVVLKIIKISLPCRIPQD
jgi:hypothetical protein